MNVSCIHVVLNSKRL